MADLLSLFEPIVGDAGIVVGDAINDDYTHDEALTGEPIRPGALVFPTTTDQVAQILAVADEHGVSVTARGAGSGLAGAAIARQDGLLVAFDRMNAILEIDELNHVATVEPGVTLAQLDEALAPLGLVYPVRPGESSATIGGTVNTNAAGMRAVKYGVTRHHVLGLEAVLAGGRVLQTGGKVVKVSSGYDLTQAIIGSEGTLALVTKIHLRLQPRYSKAATVLAPFQSIDEVTAAIPPILSTGLRPLILEYIDMFTMAVITAKHNLDVGIPDDIRQTAAAYLVIQIEGHHDDRLEADILQLGELLAGELGAMDVYVLPSAAATDLITAREHAFFAAKEANATDAIDVVVPRSALPEYVRLVNQTAQDFGTGIVGCGHAGDGNVHMAVFEQDPDKRHQIMHRLLKGGVDLGGAISGEHGIGREKKPYLAEFADPTALDLMRGIKAAFDPNGILNPGAIFD